MEPSDESCIDGQFILKNGFTGAGHQAHNALKLGVLPPRSDSRLRGLSRPGSGEPPRCTVNGSRRGPGGQDSPCADLSKVDEDELA